jgi:hypothetical protein
VIIPKAYSPEHPMGSSALIPVDPAVNNIEHLIYVNIPKNASCWARHHLGMIHAKNYNYYQQGFDKKSNLALVILRDPVERWISAMGQILVGINLYSPIHIDSIDWSSFTQEMFINNHTQPQQDFFANIPHECIVWFRCDSSLNQNFVSFLKEYNLHVDLLPAEQDIKNIFNFTKKVPKRTIEKYSGPTQQEIVDKIKTVFDAHPEYVDNLRTLYKEDYQLLNSVTYYESRQSNS